MKTTFTNKNKVNDKAKKSGMSIAETLVALVLFAVFIGGACKVLMSHRKLVDTARDNYTAIHIARNQLEQVRNTRENIGYDQIFDEVESGTRVGNDGDHDSSGRFLRSTAITAVNDRLAEVVITVQIQNRISLGFSTNHMEKIVTYIAQPQE